MPTKECVICNEQFEYTTSQVCCSPPCQDIQKKRKRKARANHPEYIERHKEIKKRHKDKIRHIRNKYENMNKVAKVCVVCQEEYVGHFSSKTCGDVCKKQHNTKRIRINRKKYLSIPKNNITARFRILCRVYLKKKGFNGGFRHLGYSGEELHRHLESQFTDGMSWDNMSDWHIDHIRPVASFNYTTTECEDFKKCWALSNLQPLWAEDNMSKGDKWDGVINA